MAAKKIHVVISQGQSLNPAKKGMEEDLAARLIMEPGVDVSIVPHLYDMAADHTGLLHLRKLAGPIVVLSWLYPRAAQWVLDRQGVRGKTGTVLLTELDEEEESKEREPGIGATNRPNRFVYCIDLRIRNRAEPYLEEVRRIMREQTAETVELLGWLGGTPTPQQTERFLNPLPIIPPPAPVPTPLVADAPALLTDPVKRRWYPVIDYSRCTNCLECIDFCLFGVYGIDTADQILVEAQDNCKKGCPACSRVCPANAIMFPQHKSPGIAGADGEIANLKIDLSKLFGGGGAGNALDMAVSERDAELVKDGREAVGTAVGLKKRQPDQPAGQKDELDLLMDGLDALD
jgi:NAD-dependent dihydropyrimidine dehydrogenase PreA subunit